jgi:hypothetical protein
MALFSHRPTTPTRWMRIAQCEENTWPADFVVAAVARRRGVGDVPPPTENREEKVVRRALFVAGEVENGWRGPMLCASMAN